MKKLISLLLVLILCLSLFAGCDAKTEEATEVEVETETPAAIDLAASFSKYAPDTVVMTVDGKDVTWSEFYYMVAGSVSKLQYYLGDIYWDHEIDTGVSYDEYVIEMAVASIQQTRAITDVSAEMKVVLDDADHARIAETEAALRLENCGEDATDEEYRTFLLEKVFLTEDVYRYINESSLLYEKLFYEVVGEAGEKVTEEEIAEYVKSVPYVTAKHILLATVNMDTGEALSPQEAAQAKETAEQLLAQLQAIKDRNELVVTFNELMTEYSKDEGCQVFPEGYTFTYGEMYTEFEEAAFSLEEYELSGIVESPAGYHILLRMPTTGKCRVDLDYQSFTYYDVLTYAATDLYAKKVDAWTNAVEVVWSGEFEGITAQEIFG